jgi:hypothetical protein
MALAFERSEGEIWYVRFDYAYHYWVGTTVVLLTLEPEP